MQMQKEIQFAENVILVDVAFLNEIAANLKSVLEDRLKRTLAPLDLVKWLSCVALDGGVRGSENEIQVLLIHEAAEDKLQACYPDSLSELDGKACRDELGEFVFYGVNPAQIVGKEQLFADLMTLAIDSANVKRLMLIPFHPQYGNSAETELHRLADEKGTEAFAKATYFVLQPPVQPLPCRTDSILFSLAQALGIRPEEM